MMLQALERLLVQSLAGGALESIAMRTTLKTSAQTLAIGAMLFGIVSVSVAQQTSPPNSSAVTPQTPVAQPAIEEWGDDFDGDQLDLTKWEPYTFEGGGGGKIELKDKQLKLRGAGGSRSGVRSKQSFRSERFYVEAALTKVGPRTPQPGEEAFPPGFAILTVLFDGNSTNRIEWLLRSDGIFEAWQSVDGRMIRVDNGKLATKEKNPKLGIARRGDKIFFMLNREVGLESTIRDVSSDFKVMLYGFGSSENHWDSIAVQTLKQ